MNKFNRAWIVDDDTVYIYGLKSLMKYVNFCDQSEVYKDGFEAINKLQLIAKYDPDELPDVILLDIKMPVWDGWEFIKHFENITVKKDIKLYVVTASLNPDDRKKAENFNIVSNFFLKPVTTVELREMMGAELV